MCRGKCEFLGQSYLKVVLEHNDTSVFDQLRKLDSMVKVLRFEELMREEAKQQSLSVKRQQKTPAKQKFAVLEIRQFDAGNKSKLFLKKEVRHYLSSRFSVKVNYVCLKRVDKQNIIGI